MKNRHETLVERGKVFTKSTDRDESHAFGPRARRFVLPVSLVVQTLNAPPGSRVSASATPLDAGSAPPSAVRVGEMYERLRARELDPGGRLGARAARGGRASTSSVSVSRAHDESLRSWAESDALRHCTATYSELRPAPRSTIAAAYSPDGKLLASTHGDHTVKLIDCRTGRCVRVLTGHRRTPWVVRFHPSDSNVLVSGSLDHQVRVWNATSAECILCFDFGKPIASLAFNAAGDVLAVASGHKLYAWRYRNMPQWDERRASRDPEARAAAARDAAAAVAAHEDAINAVRDGLGRAQRTLPAPVASVHRDVSEPRARIDIRRRHLRRGRRFVSVHRAAHAAVAARRALPPARRAAAAQRGGERDQRARRASAARADQPQPQGRVGNSLRGGVGGGDGGGGRGRHRGGGGDRGGAGRHGHGRRPRAWFRRSYA
jgi:activator-of-BECN1-regulated-autophagy protein 1